MLIGIHGTAVGSLSGGCLEEEVAQRAADVIRSGTPVVMEFDTRRRFGCNGSIEIFVEAVRNNFVDQLAGHLRERRSCRAITVFSGPAAELGSRIIGADEMPPAGALVQEVQPPLQLIIFGDGPDSIPLRSFAELLGWGVIETAVAHEVPAQLDKRTAAVVKSHNYGRDFAALQRLLQADLRYVGLLGPRKRRDQLLGDLLDIGITLNAEFFAPAGLDLRAETPEEIALAIVAEIQAIFASGTGESLRDRKAPIHGWNIAPASAASSVNECALSAP